MAKDEEKSLAALSKRLLSMPHKPREDSKLGKSKAEPKKSQRATRKAPRKRG